VLAIGDDVAGDPPGVDQATMRGREDALACLLPGPRIDWFAGDALATLTRGPYVVTAASNRTALRLDGAVLMRSIERELPSEGVVPGAVQVPPDGKPVVFLVDHPVTGGYPVVAVVRDADLDVLAQRRPGDTVRFARAV
jgi:allophanate hydrolase subunit 2